MKALAKLDGLIITRLGREDLKLALDVREMVLRSVFDIPAEEDIGDMVEANRAALWNGLADGSCIMLLAFPADGTADREFSDFIGSGVICLAHELPSPDAPSGVIAIVMNVFTRNAHRGKGIARTILKELIALAHEVGADKIVLDTTVAAAPLYREVGFVPYESGMIWKG